MPNPHLHTAVMSGLIAFAMPTAAASGGDKHDRQREIASAECTDDAAAQVRKGEKAAAPQDERPNRKHKSAGPDRSIYGVKLISL